MSRRACGRRAAVSGNATGGQWRSDFAAGAREAAAALSPVAGFVVARHVAVTCPPPFGHAAACPAQDEADAPSLPAALAVAVH